MKRLIAAIALVLAACGQGAAPLTIDDAQYRAPLGASGIGVAYFSITSSTDDRIVGVSSPQADHIEMHTSVSEGSQVSMKRMQDVELPAGKPVVFGPNG
ncbi:MAG: copper chaperone PCu(A)C, partial [Hyphomonadaceae bacterium]|nr:copper chaperone PCu(A)C [Hyphomonadaceae bacterium]